MKLDQLRYLDRAIVFRGGLRAGQISRTNRGSIFEYDEYFRDRSLASDKLGVAFSLSPLQAQHEIVGVNLHPFFAGLLPEGLRLKALKQSVKTSEDDLFTMLLALGPNCVGDVALGSDEAQAETQAELSGSQELKAVDFNELFERSIYQEDYNLRRLDYPLSGVMPKVSASMISFPVNIAKRRARYLLKLSSPDHPQIVENECFFMTLAKRCAIAVPSVKIVYDRRGSAALLVQRFDRQFDVETKQFFSIHQEDACQFLNRFPQDKYRLSMSEIAEALIRLSATPLVCLRRLLELYAFSYLIGNGDLHAKNISLLVDPLSGQPKLAPAYDLLTTLPYGDRKMALKLDGRDDQFTFQNFSNFGKRYGLPETALKISFKKLASRSLEGMKDAERIGFGARRHQDLSRTFRLRVEKLLEGC